MNVKIYPVWKQTNVLNVGQIFLTKIDISRLMHYLIKIPLDIQIFES